MSDRLQEAKPNILAAWVILVDTMKVRDILKLLKEDGWMQVA